MPLYESEDLIVTKILDFRDSRLDVEVTGRIDEETKSAFRDYREFLLFNLRSSIGRFAKNGIPIATFEPEGNYISGNIRVYNFIPRYIPKGATLEQLVEEGAVLGKCRLDDPSTKVSAELARQYIEDRSIITGPNPIVHESGIVTLPLRMAVYEPTNELTVEALKDIISGNTARSRLSTYQQPKELTTYQQPKEVGKIIVPKNSGVIVATTLITSGIGVKVLDQPQLGINHSEARFGRATTRYEFFGEYMGNPIHDAELTGMDVVFKKPAVRQKKYFVPRAIKDDSETALDENHVLISAINYFKYRANHPKYIEFVDFSGLKPKYGTISREQARDLGAFVESLSNSQNLRLLFNQFPGRIGQQIEGDIMRDLRRLAEDGKLREVRLLNGTNGIFFVAEAIEELAELATYATVYKRNPYTGKWMKLIDDIWVKPEYEREFRLYTRSGRYVVSYGSSTKMSDETPMLIDKTQDAIMRFFGGKAAHSTGGWGKPGSFMKYAGTGARKRGFLVISINWDVGGQSTNIDADAEQSYDERSLLHRQQTLGRRPEIEIFGDAGDGTWLEWNYSNTMLKPGIGARKLRLILNPARSLLDKAEEMYQNGLSPGHVLKSTHIVDARRDVDAILYNHFKTSY